MARIAKDQLDTTLTALGNTTTGSGNIVLATSPALTTPNLGTPSAATLTSATGLPLTTGVTGTLPVANGGTGATTLTGIVKGNGTSAMTAVTAPTGVIVGTTDTQTLTNKTIDGSQLVNTSVSASKLNLGASTALVTTNESTSSTTYTDLTTTTDTISVTVGASGVLLVGVRSELSNNTSGQASYMSFALSGANTLAAADANSIATAAGAIDTGCTTLLTGLTAGSTTVKAKYRVTGGTGSFNNRKIFAVPLG